jgi:nitrogen fixation protein FixH
MSHIPWIPPPSDNSPEAARTVWRFFPWLIAAAIGVVVAVNAGMIYAAVASFPGKTGDEGFALSNHYNGVLDRAQHDAELGWTMVARTNGMGRPEIILTDRHGSPLRAASVAASARRPVGIPETHQLVFHETTDGTYVADLALRTPGQWDLTVAAFASGHETTATRRIIVR